MKANHTYRLRVPFSDIDMLGHVNNAKYFTYLETARTDHLLSGFDKLLENRPASVIIARAEIDYLSPAKWNDELAVKLRTSAVGNTSWTYEYEIMNEEDNRLVAKGKTVQVAYDYTKATKISIPPKLREALVKEMEDTKDEV